MMVLPSGDTSSEGQVTSVVSNSMVSAVLRTSSSGVRGASDCGSCERTGASARTDTTATADSRPIFMNPPGGAILPPRRQRRHVAYNAPHSLPSSLGNTMRLRTAMIVSLIVACAAAAAAQAPQPAGRGQGRGQGRGPLTPEQQEQQRARELASGPEAVRPIEALDSVWIEEQTWMETRDAIRASKTIAIIGSGGNEQNGPYAPNGKHNYVLRTTCEAIARKLGNALCAPIVTLEPGNPEREGLTPGSVFITQATFNAILTD